MAAYVRGAAEDELFARADVAFHCAVDFCDGYLNYCLRHLRAGAYDQRAVRGNDVAGKVTVDSQHRLETDLAAEVDHVTNETKPVVLVYVCPLAINGRRLAAFVSARNCWSSHAAAPSVLFRYSVD